MHKYLRDLLTLPGDALGAWRREGATGLRTELAERTIRRVWRRSHMLVIAQDLAACAVAPTPPGVAVRPFEGDWSALAGITTARQRAGFAHAVARGRHCLVAWHEGRPLGYTWLSERMERDVEFHELPLAADAVYLWNLWVLPSARNLGIGSALVSARLRLALDLGYREGWRMVAPDNAPSLRTVAKTAGTGTRLVAELYVRKLGARARVRYVPVTGPAAALPWS